MWGSRALKHVNMLSGFGEESEQEVKEAVKPTGNSYTWEELAKYNEMHNVHVAVRGKVLGKVSEIILCSDYYAYVSSLNSH